MKSKIELKQIASSLPYMLNREKKKKKIPVNQMETISWIGSNRRLNFHNPHSYKYGNNKMHFHAPYKMKD